MSDLDKMFQHGWNALLVAAHQGDLEEIKNLIAQGANKDIVGIFECTSIMIAARQKHYEVVKYLLEQGVRLDQKDKNGRTLADRAEEDPKLVAILAAA